MRDGRKLAVCDQIVPNWRWRNQQRNGIMDIEPFYGAPGEYSDYSGMFCFVVLPLEEPFTLIYDDPIRKVVEAMQYECRKADDFYSAAEVMKDI